MTQPFGRTVLINEAGLVGARWWQDSMSAADDPIARRQALTRMGLIGAAIGAVGLGIVVINAASGPDETIENKDSLEMQRYHGWNFGSDLENLTFDGASYATFDPTALPRLGVDLSPTTSGARPFHSATLFESIDAVPRMPLPDVTVQPLRQVIKPISTLGMGMAYRRGLAIAGLFAGQPDDVALIVDLRGPDSVAFAAGIAGKFDLVTTFDNWPHPRGVVPAHLTLASAAFYQPRFAKLRATRGASPLAFILDRSRLNAYTDSTTQFDNRHVARLPTAANLRALGVKHLLYVAPEAADSLELDDLNADFVAFATAGLDVKMLATSDLSPEAGLAMPAGTAPEEWPTCFYGGAAATHDAFWTRYKWHPPKKPPRGDAKGVSNGASYVPTPRATVFSSTGFSKQRPTGMGMIPVAVALGTGVVLGAAASRRSGSYGRSSGSSGG